jgi:hypothetical protein
MRPQGHIQIQVFLWLMWEFERIMIAMTCLDARASSIKGWIVDGTQWVIPLRVNLDCGGEENGTRSL